MADSMIALGVALLPIFIIAFVAYKFDGVASEILEDDEETRGP